MVMTVVGFGEAGQAFAEGWSFAPGELRAYDIALHDPTRAARMRTAFQHRGVSGCGTAEDAFRGASAVFCLVPTEQAVAAAEAAAPLLDQGTLWIDGSSSAPSTKVMASAAIERGHGHYVDMAIMAPVLPLLHRTPVLLSGKHAGAAARVADTLGMAARVVGESIGDASSVKMLRSIIIKGLEALTAECFLAARIAGLEGLVLDSLKTSGEPIDWPVRTEYNLGRMVEHGVRRADEMREVTKTLQDLGMPAWMASSTASWQDRLAGLHSSGEGAGLTAVLDDLLEDFR